APRPHASPAGSGLSPERPFPAHSTVTGKVRVPIASRSSILSVSDRSTAPLICSVCLPRARSGRAKWLLTKNWDSGVMESDRFSSDVSTLKGSAERIFTPALLRREGFPSLLSCEGSVGNRPGAPRLAMARPGFCREICERTLAAALRFRGNGGDGPRIGGSGLEPDG